MITVEIGDLGEVERLLEKVDERELFHKVIYPAFLEMGKYAELLAKQAVPKWKGVLMRSIHTSDPRHVPFMKAGVMELIADAPHALWQEMGFRAHWVPLHLSLELQQWCAAHLGWRLVPRPPGADARHTYMRDTNGNLHWGVGVSGRAQPFMRPAAAAAGNVAPRIMGEWMNRHLRGA